MSIYIIFRFSPASQGSVSCFPKESKTSMSVDFYAAPIQPQTSKHLTKTYSITLDQWVTQENRVHSCSNFSVILLQTHSQAESAVAQLKQWMRLLVIPLRCYSRPKFHSKSSYCHPVIVLWNKKGTVEAPTARISNSYSITVISDIEDYWCV